MPRVPGTTTQEELVRQVKVTNRLLAAQLKSTSKIGQMELVALLDGLGLTAKDLAEVLGTTAATVAVTLNRVRNKAKSARPKAERQNEE
jgi:DNA-directed RNA polymerase specialized sigma24 family protein